jgi:tRNA nucleotidyltransferase (CCA-adding enzyme)
MPLDIPITPSVHQALLSLSWLGHRGLIVGGAVRDALMGLTPKDVDIEVYGLEYRDLAAFLAAFGQVDLVGRSFGVIKLTTDEGYTYDFSVPRKDNKREDDPSRQGFDVQLSSDLTPEEAARRRDYTCNALAFCPLKGELLDFFRGQEHIRAGQLFHTDEDTFIEDPLRVLRGMQFCARFAWSPSLQTASLCSKLAQQVISKRYGQTPDPELEEEPELRCFSGSRYYERRPYPHHALSRGDMGPRLLARERVAEEWMKWATRSVCPTRGIQALWAMDWAQNFYPELEHLCDCPQEPEWHPEGTVDLHTEHVADAAQRIAVREGLEEDDRAVLMFAALCHDFAKATHTERMEKNGVLRWASHGHEEAGGPLARRFLNRIGIKPAIVEQVVPLVENHLAHIRFTDEGNEARSIRRLAQRLQPANLRMLAFLMEADHSGRPPLPTGMPEGAQRMLELADSHQVYHQAPQPIILGRYVLPYFENKPGKHIGIVTKAAFEAQLDGAFSDLETGLSWLEAHVKEQA